MIILSLDRYALLAGRMEAEALRFSNINRPEFERKLILLAERSEVEGLRFSNFKRSEFERKLILRSERSDAEALDFPTLTVHSLSGNEYCWQREARHKLCGFPALTGVVSTEMNLAGRAK